MTGKLWWGGQMNVPYKQQVQIHLRSLFNWVPMRVTPVCICPPWALLLLWESFHCNICCYSLGCLRFLGTKSQATFFLPPRPNQHKSVSIVAQLHVRSSAPPWGNTETCLAKSLSCWTFGFSDNISLHQRIQSFEVFWFKHDESKFIFCLMN